MNARRSHLTPAAIFFVAVLALGAACHLWHHLTDADCDRLSARHPAPCLNCVGLHAAALAAAILEVPRTNRCVAGHLLQPQPAEGASAEPRAPAPRAPPVL